MSFIVKGSSGVSTLSALTIDVDKDWAGKGISNLKELALAMTQGDLVVRGAGGVLVKLSPGVANTMLTSAGPGLIPFWGPGGFYLNRYYPATIYLGVPTVTKNPTRSHNQAETPSITTDDVEVLDDQPASMVKMISPAVTLPGTQTKNTARTYTQGNTPASHTHFDLTQVLEAAVADDGGVQVDETAAAKNATANDMTLFPAVPVNNDAYYFGSDYKFDELILNIGTAGAGVWAVAWEYYHSDTTWHALAGLTDGTSAFQAAAGSHSVLFTKDANWTAVAVAAISKYWIRCRMSAYTSIVTQPKGTQAWYKITI